MSSLKIILLIGFFGVGTGILLVWIYNQDEFSPKLPIQPVPVEVKTSKPEPEKVNTPPAQNQDKKLQAQANAFLPLYDNMPPVMIQIKDEQVIKSGTNTERSDAYTNCEKGGIPSIVVKKIVYQKFNQTRLTILLKHELTHAWLCRQNLMSTGHGALFRKKFSQAVAAGN